MAEIEKENPEKEKALAKVLHLLHYAHHLHLAADSVEHLLEGAEEAAKVAKVARGLLDSQRMIRRHAQMAFDLARMHNRIFRLRAVVEFGGEAGITAGYRLIRARGAYNALSLTFEAERSQVAVARQMVSMANWAKLTPHGAATARWAPLAMKLEPYAIRIEHLLKGSQTVRFLTSKTATRGLIVVAGAVSAVESYMESPVQTQGGKIANAALGGAAGVLPMLSAPVAAIDLVAPKGYKPSELYHGTADELAAIGEAIITKDSKPLDEVHKRSMEGSYGKVMQVAAEAGEFWDKKGIVGGLKEFGDSVRWWVSQ